MTDFSNYFGADYANSETQTVCTASMLPSVNRDILGSFYQERT